MLLHIARQNDWEQAKANGLYQAESLLTEGFIHCSLPEQVLKVANTFYLNQSGLVLLCIHPDQVKAEIKYEAADNDEFPHIYGPLNVDAIFQVLPFEPGEEGRFELPKLLVNELAEDGQSIELGY